jgi:hypothetical protein
MRKKKKRMTRREKIISIKRKISNMLIMMR